MGMCAVLDEEPVARDPGYGGEPQTVNFYQCGGSLIVPGVILTAVHCAAKFQQEPTKLKIRCGEWDTQNQTEPRPHQDRYVQNLDIHPEFNPRNLANDWAVLYTSQDFDLQAHIDTICLPQPEELFNGQTCFATGWGKDQFGAAGNYKVFWQPIDAAPLTTGGNGYVDGGDVDISNFERDNYPAAPLTDGTDGYSEPKTVDSAPLTDDSYSETKTADTAPLTDGSYSEPETAPQTEGSYDDAPPVKLTQGAYTEDTADLTGEVKAPGPVY